MLKELLNEAAKKNVEEYKVKAQTSSEMYGGELSVSGGKEKKYFPSINLYSSTLPEITDWKVGEDYYVLMKLTQKSLSVSKDRADASFDITEIAVIEPDTDDETDD